MRPGVVTRLIVFFFVLTGASVVFAIFRERLGDPFLLGMLGVLAMIGVGYLFATAIGFVQFAPRSTNDELAKAFADTMAQGLLVTDLKGRIIYANRAYADMTGATDRGRRQDDRGAAVGRAGGIVDRLPAGVRRARRAGRRRRVPAGTGHSARAPSPARAGTGCAPAPSTCRASASRSRPGRSPTSRASAPSRSASSSTCRRRSTISTTRRPASSPPTRTAASPISTRRSPSGWASTLRASRRATPRFREIIAGDGMALVRSVQGRSGHHARYASSTSTSRRSTARRCRCASCTASRRPATARRARAAPSCSTASQGEDASAELRASEIRFTRFFNSTPMAIAGVDQSGRILRTNAPFLSLFSHGRRPRRRRPPRAPRHRRSTSATAPPLRGARKGAAAAGRHRADRHGAARQ